MDFNEPNACRICKEQSTHLVNNRMPYAPNCTLASEYFDNVLYGGSVAPITNQECIREDVRLVMVNVYNLILSKPIDISIDEVVKPVRENYIGDTVMQNAINYVLEVVNSRT